MTNEMKPLLDVEEIGVRVRTRRYMIGMTQADLAEATGLTIESISRIENGRNQGPPRPTTLAKIAKALDVPVTTFTQV